MLNPLAIALQGIGFEPIVLALQGFADVVAEVTGEDYYRQQSTRRKKKVKKPENIQVDYAYESEAILLLLS